MTPERFVKLLQDQKLSDEHRHNFYCPSEENPGEARMKSKNLLLYLKKMQELDPKILLVGEAPGYKGCKRSGIPFTSEYQILNNDFFKGEFEVFNTDNPKCEKSAKVIWDTIEKTRQFPLMWNIYPFHPSTRDGRNGKPNAKDVDMGKDILEKLLTMFNISCMYCIGRKSEYALKNHKLFKGYVRHPSHGGIRECKESLENILNRFTK
ncbi:MAG: uracil-DNA glycosylase [Muribaculaceae bacterium]|nr:uracil-DNA glycosylase [Muribaculaceae bacterium]